MVFEGDPKTSGEARKLVSSLLSELEASNPSFWSLSDVLTCLKLSSMVEVENNIIQDRAISIGKRALDISRDFEILSRLAKCAAAKEPPDWDSAIGFAEAAYANALEKGESRRACLNLIAAFASKAREWSVLEYALRRQEELGPKRRFEADTAQLDYFLSDVPKGVINEKLRSRYIHLCKGG